MAATANSIANKQNCGGPKKAGLAPSVGHFVTSNIYLWGAPHNLPPVLPCKGNFTVTVPRRGIAATRGGMGF